MDERERERLASKEVNGDLEVEQLKAKGHGLLPLKSKLKRWKLEWCVCLRNFSQEAFH